MMQDVYFKLKNIDEVHSGYFILDINVQIRETKKSMSIYRNYDVSVEYDAKTKKITHVYLKIRCEDTDLETYYKLYKKSYNKIMKYIKKTIKSYINDFN